jgi:hypothetical protein
MLARTAVSRPAASTRVAARPPGVDASDNELVTLETVHLFVEILDHFFSNVCELDLVFNFHKVVFSFGIPMILGFFSDGLFGGGP